MLTVSLSLPSQLRHEIERLMDQLSKPLRIRVRSWVSKLEEHVSCRTRFQSPANAPGHASIRVQ